jgi:hypothetical protein
VGLLILLPAIDSGTLSLLEFTEDRDGDVEFKGDTQVETELSVDVDEETG